MMCVREIQGQHRRTVETDMMNILNTYARPLAEKMFSLPI